MFSQVFVCPQGGRGWLPSMHHRSHDQGVCPNPPPQCRHPPLWVRILLGCIRVLRAIYSKNGLQPHLIWSVSDNASINIDTLKISVSPQFVVLRQIAVVTSEKCNMRYIRNLSYFMTSRYEPNGSISESITNNHVGISKCHKLSANTDLSNAIEAGKNTTFCKENKLSVTARFAMRRFAVLCLMYPLYTVKITNKLPTNPKNGTTTLMITLMRSIHQT